MKYQGKSPQENLDQAIAALRAEQPSPEVMQPAADRVWSQLSQEMTGAPGVESIRGCDDVRRLLLQYRNGELSSARALLVEAHLHECVHCRREAESDKPAPARLAPWKQELPRATFGGMRWAVAAVAILAVGLSAYFVREKLFAGPAGMRASVVSFEGGLYRVGFSGEQALKPGDELQEGEKVRTGPGSHAMLRLRDGSVVEMNERAQFAVSMRRNDTTVNLDRGKIIVQAAKRKTGHLYVAANDVNVSVTGTVFSVNSGMKGSRVSVIEGEVRVASTGVDGILRNDVLHSGDQVSTDAAGPVPVKQEIAWSKNLDKHLALLAEFAHLQNKLEAVQIPGMRYQSKVLPTLPAGTILYASIPNLGDAVQQANKLFQQELEESAVLKEWWDQTQSRKRGASFNQIVEEIHALSQYVGDEIVFSVALDGRDASPMVVAQVQKSGLKQFIEQEAARHNDGTKPSHLHVFEGNEIMSAREHRGEGLVLLVRPDFVAAAVDPAVLQNFNRTLNQGIAGGFAATPFGQRMAAAYQQGAGLLFGADLQAMTAEHAAAHPYARHDEKLASSGLADVRFLVAERKDAGNQTVNRAELTFTGTRHGLASWLAAPAPIGGLDFVSKDAAAAVAIVAKNPSQMLDDVLAMAGAEGAANLAKGESELKIQFRQDLADTLGGEATFALDGPILPTPSWKAILEVYNPGRLQATIQQLINDANDHMHEAANRVALDQEASSGLTFYTIRFTDGSKSVEVNYTYADGFMILAPSRALVMNAIAVHQNGNSLVRSGSFRSLLPQDQHTDVSAVLYQNLAPVVGPVMQQLSPSQLQSLQQLAAETKPSVVCAYGEPDAIRVASNSRFFGLDLNTMTLSTLMKMAHPSGAPERRSR